MKWFRRNATVHARVAKGVTVLEAFDSEWFNRVDIRALHMGSIYMCVVAQVTGREYGHGLQKLGFWSGDDGAVAHGFNAPGGWNGLFRSQFEQLNKEWIRVIRAKRAEQMDRMLQELDVN